MPILAHKCKGSLPTYTLECEVEETILQALANRQLLNRETSRDTRALYNMGYLDVPIFSCKVLLLQ